MYQSQILNVHTDTVLSVNAHSSREIIASGSDDCTAKIWDLNSGNLILTIQDTFEGNPVNNVCFGPNDTLYCTYDNVIVSFDIRQSDQPILKQFKNQYKYNTEEVNQINFDSKYQYLGACDDSGQIKIIDINKNRLVETLDKKHTNITTSVVFRPNTKNELLTGSMDYSIIHWDFLKSKVLHRDQFKDGALPTNISKKPSSQSSSLPDDPSRNQMLNPPFVTSIDISNNSKHVSVSTGDGTVTINEINSFKQYLKISSAHNASCSIVHYPKYLENNYNQLISVGNYDKKVILWDISEETNSNVLSLFSSGECKTITDINNKRIKTQIIMDEKINSITTSTLKKDTIYIGDMTSDIKVLTTIV